MGGRERRKEREKNQVETKKKKKMLLYNVNEISYLKHSSSQQHDY